jgi:hypothetical protein
MAFICKHCGGTAFRLLTGVNGKPAAECLNCGRASSFDQSHAPNPSAPVGSTRPGPATE